MQGGELTTQPPVASVRSRPLPEAETETVRAIYLCTDFEPVFAMVHLPRRSRARSAGVVICPTFGWDDLCTFRARREWATRLASAGHAVVRFDLQGTGDSPGTAFEPDRLGAWTAAVAAAATWLRQDGGCARVTGLGIGFGGMLAWRAVALGQPVDDLILWATPTQGRRMLREARTAAALGIDNDIKDEQALAAVPADAGGLLDEAGQLTSQETLDSLSHVDLTKLPLPGASGRRVLVFERARHDADRAVAEFFKGAGAAVTIADGEGYEPMMRYVQQSQIPVEAIERSLAWLAEPTTGSSTRGAAVSAQSTALSLEHLDIEWGGVAIRERPLTLEVDGHTLRGIITEPVGVPSAGICALFFSGGSDRRIGPNRLWVDASRRWAAAGLHAVRIDPAGVGDSEGDDRTWDQLPSHYAPDHVDNTIKLLDAVQDRGLPSRFILTGFCSGAYRSLHVAMRDERVAGVFAIGLPFFYWTPWVRLRDWWVQDGNAADLDARWKQVVMRGLQRILPSITRARRVGLWLLSRRTSRKERALHLLSERGTQLELLFKLGSHEWAELAADSQLDRLAALPGVELRVVPGRDMRFRPLALQAFVDRSLDAGLARIMAARGH
jgi:pimeloyl-ACP methyl ester carboxylesterase